MHPALIELSITYPPHTIHYKYILVVIYLHQHWHLCLYCCKWCCHCVRQPCDQDCSSWYWVIVSSILFSSKVWHMYQCAQNVYENKYMMHKGIKVTASTWSYVSASLQSIRSITFWLCKCKCIQHQEDIHTAQQVFEDIRYQYPNEMPTPTWHELYMICHYEVHPMSSALFHPPNAVPRPFCP